VGSLQLISTLTRTSSYGNVSTTHSTSDLQNSNCYWLGQIQPNAPACMTSHIVEYDPINEKMHWHCSVRDVVGVAVSRNRNTFIR